ncbi:unnamed protein product, partial [Phaeothamnion confervicola]
ELCEVCGHDTEEQNLIVYCEDCDMGVHQACYGIRSIPRGAWRCGPCAAARAAARLAAAVSAGAAAAAAAVDPLAAMAGLRGATLAVSCRLCPNRGGALKRCTDGSWAHVVCCIWVPECCFLDQALMEPIASIDTRGRTGDISMVPRFRWARNCRICATRRGAAIRCRFPGCKFLFHPACGRRAGNVYMDLELMEDAAASLALVALCPTHGKAKL